MLLKALEQPPAMKPKFNEVPILGNSMVNGRIFTDSPSRCTLNSHNRRSPTLHVAYCRCNYSTMLRRTTQNPSVTSSAQKFPHASLLLTAQSIWKSDVELDSQISFPSRFLCYRHTLLRQHLLITRMDNVGNAHIHCSAI